MYFIYAPPRTALDAVSRDRPNPPYRGAPDEQCSVYYYWWAFLRENAEYMGCCANKGRGGMAALYKDFGDVRGEDFMGWWKRHGRQLFCEPEAEAVQLHLVNPWTYPKGGRLFIEVPTNGDFQRIMMEIRDQLKPVLPSKQKPVSHARRPVHTKPVLTTLHQILKVWQARKANPEAPYAEIAKIAGIRLDKLASSESTTVVALKRVAVSRYLKAARHIIANVGEGRFPDTSPPKQGKPERRVDTTTQNTKSQAPSF